jgi:hypothetical protein
MKKKWLVLLIVVVVVVGAFTAPVFPDPYHEDGNVTFAEWIYREIDELLHGEKEA